MKMHRFGFSTYIGLGVVIFVTLVGALGYSYVMTNKAEVATHSDGSSSNTIAAETITPPEIEQTSDLDDALEALDEASVDNLSEDDLDALEAELNNL